MTNPTEDRIGKDTQSSNHKCILSRLALRDEPTRTVTGLTSSGCQKQRELESRLLCVTLTVRFTLQRAR